MRSEPQKVGDTWEIDGALTDIAGNAIDLTGLAVYAAIKDPSSGAVTSFSASILDAAAGAFRLVMASDDTGQLTGGTVYLCDVEFRDEGVSPPVVRSSRTFEVEVEGDITNASAP